MPEFRGGDRPSRAGGRAYGSRTVMVLVASLCAGGMVIAGGASATDHPHVKPTPGPGPLPKPRHIKFRAGKSAGTTGPTAVGGATPHPDVRTASTTVTNWSALASAFSAGGTVILGANIEAGQGQFLIATPGSPVTLDLNGNNLLINAPGDFTTAIGVASGDQLTLQDSSGGLGELFATGGYNAPGIGATGYDSNGNGLPAGTVDITAGTFYVSGGFGAPGIGGFSGGGNDTANGGAGGTVLISGGTVNANGGAFAPGIGGAPGNGAGGAGGTTTVSGGTVTATPGDSSPGIGGGYGISGAGGAGGSLNVSGGNVNSTGGGTSPGIGGGYGAGGAGGSGGTLTVSAGTVTATGGGYGAGVGGGYGGGGAGGAGTNVTVSGGSLNAFGSDNGPGIGGGLSSAAAGGAGGTVNVSAGNVSAVGGFEEPGIGGGSSDTTGGSGGTVNITGGTVSAYGGQYGVGIGGGAAPTSGSGAAITVGSAGLLEAAGDSADGFGPVGAGYGTSAGGFGSLSNAGELYVPSGQVQVVPSGVTITNNGALYNAGTIDLVGSTLSGTGTIENAGTIVPSSGGVITGGGQGPAGTSQLVDDHDYTLNLNPGTGSLPGGTTNPVKVYAPSVVAAQASLPFPTPPSGYAFTGWFTAATGGTRVQDSTTLASALGVSDTTTTAPTTAPLYAQYASLTIGDVVIAAQSGNSVFGAPAPNLSSPASVTGLHGSDQLSAQPVCRITTPDTKVGTYPVTCSGASAPAGYTITYVAGSYSVTQAATSTVVSASPNPANFGQTVTLTATVTQPAGTGTACTSGTVVFTSKSSKSSLTLGSASTNNAGVATLSTTALTTGASPAASDTITATYTPSDTADCGVSAATTTETVNVVSLADTTPGHRDAAPGRETS